MKEIILMIGAFLASHKLAALIVALIALIVANTLLGAVIAGIKMDFKKEVLVRGLLKHTAIAFAIFLIYVAGLCVPNLQLVTINGDALTLIEALDTGFLSALAVYAGKVIKNLYVLLTIDAKNAVEEINPTSSVPTFTELDVDVE